MAARLGPATYEWLGEKIGKNLAGFITRVSRTVVLKGSVMDGQNTPLPHVKVALCVKRNFLGEVLQGTTFTDESGKYECRFDWVARPFDSSEFTFVLKFFQNETLLREERFVREAHAYPRFKYLSHDLNVEVLPSDEEKVPLRK